MTTRTDIIVDYFTSPRVAVVQPPSQEFAVQDIVDTLRKHEDQFRGNSENKLLNASGKESLGGGVEVGITCELQNTQIAFEGRTSIDQAGTVTSPSGPPVGNSPSRKNGLILLEDTSALFVTNGVNRGSLIINFTDQSIAEVYHVLTETVLIAQKPVNGTDNSFDLNDVYHIYNVDQCQVLGGNLVAVDENGDEISPFSATVFTQLVRSLSSSATLVNNPSAEDYAQVFWDYDITNAIGGSVGDITRRSAFGGYIHIDSVNGTSGQTWPQGTEKNPVNSVSDAVAIGIREGIFRIKTSEDITILSTDVVDGFTFEGLNPEKTDITVQSGASTKFTNFKFASLTGTMSGRIYVDRCFVDDIVNFEGTMQETLLGGVITLSGSSPAYLLSCYSDNTGSPLPEPIINMNGSGYEIIAREYSGEMRIINKTGDDKVTISFVSGGLVIDSTVSGGEFNLQGVYSLIDNSSGSPGVTFVQNTNLDTIEIKVDNVQTDIDVIDTKVDAILVSVSNFGAVIDDLIKYQRNKSVIDPVFHTLTIYEDNGTTPLTIFDLQDENGVASCTSVFRRIPR